MSGAWRRPCGGGWGPARWPGSAAWASRSPSPTRESCPSRSADAGPAAVAGAVSTGSAANQAGDGAFLYRYDRDEEAVVPGYSTVRHAGTLLALEQAAAAGVDGAAEAAAARARVGPTTS